MIKYLGSKRLLVSNIAEAVARFDNVSSFADAFSGTSHVGYHFKKCGKRVLSNDAARYAYTFATCYIAADAKKYADDASKIIADLQKLPGKYGYFTDTFCVRSRFLQPFNGEKIDAMRDEVARLSLDPVLEAVVLTSIVEAADRVDSTVALQSAYLKKWSKRSYDSLTLRLPELVDSNERCEAFCGDASDFVASIDADLVYIDPPYNQHSYIGNYHVWETLVRWDAPEHFGVACKRRDYNSESMKSDYNSKKKFLSTFNKLIRSLKSKYAIVSFSNESFITYDQVVEILMCMGNVSVVSIPHKRYIGSKIGGSTNLSGVRSGGHASCVEYLFCLDMTLQYARVICDISNI